MEKYVVSRELAENLKAAGYPQDTQFSHFKAVNEISRGLPIVMPRSSASAHVLNRQLVCAAPLSDELLEQIPDTYEVEKGITASFVIRKHKGLYAVGYMYVGSRVLYCSKSSRKLVDALAELYLFSKENNYV